MSLLAASAAGVSAQQSAKYEIERDMPLFLDSIKKELTYPLAWGNSDITDFDTWRSTARDKVMELMLAPPPRADISPISSPKWKTRAESVSVSIPATLSQPDTTWPAKRGIAELGKSSIPSSAKTI